MNLEMSLNLNVLLSKYDQKSIGINFHSMQVDKHSKAFVNVYQRKENLDCIYTVVCSDLLVLIGSVFVAVH